MNGGTITFKFTGDTKELDKSVDKVKSNVTSKMASIGSAIGKGVAVGVGAATTALAEGAASADFTSCISTKTSNCGLSAGSMRAAPTSVIFLSD